MLKIKIDKLSDSFYMIHFHAYCIVFHLLLYSNWFRSTKKWWNQLLSRIFTVKLNALSQVSCFVILLSMKLELPWILRFLASILLTKFVILVRGLCYSWEKWGLYSKGKILSGRDWEEGSPFLSWFVSNCSNMYRLFQRIHQDRHFWSM